MQTIDHIDVSDLPTPIANGLAVVAEMARHLNTPVPLKGTESDDPFPLAVVKGNVIGSLSREELYDHI